MTIQKIIAWPLCVILLIGLTVVESTDALCVDNDGQIEIEKLGFLCCTNTEDPCKSEQTNNQSNDQKDCADCLDLELDGMYWSNIKLNEKKGRTTDATPLRIISYGDNFAALLFAPSSFVTSPYADGQNLPAILVESIVLRC